MTLRQHLPLSLLGMAAMLLFFRSAGYDASSLGIFAVAWTIGALLAQFFWVGR